MLKFLEAPIMTIEDAMEIAPAYDKYDSPQQGREARRISIEDAMDMAPVFDTSDFPQGPESCDQVLKEYFQDDKKILANLDRFVDAVLVAEDTANLNEVKNVGVPHAQQGREAPMEARPMMIEDAMEMAPLYDQHDFHEGRELCDQVMKEYFQDNKKILANLDCFVDAVVVADAANLNQAKKVGVKWICQTFSSRDSHTGGIIFTENHIRKLIPLISKEDHLFQIITYVIALFSGTDIESKENLRSPLFPCALVMAFEKWETRRMLRNEFTHIMLSGTGCEADGICTRDPWDEYDCNRTGLWAGVQVNFAVAHLEDEAGWAIIGATLPEIDEDGNENDDNVVSKILWRCPNSHNLPLPPQDGWIPVHEMAIGRQPTVCYL
jgi:hypothetical protein